ncbi:MAG: STAS/SEC14 domain-containing protein [Desulfobacterales bacterium]|nr:STAS/SEC14 domain-containing protein [Desulfobacterales bacterium]
MTLEFKYQNDPDTYLEIVFSGQVTDHDLQTAWNDFLQSGEWIPGVNILNDVSRADLTHLTTEGIEAHVADIESYIQMFGEDMKAGNIAVYAPSPLQFGISMIFTGYGVTTAETIKVFKDRQEAISWLFEK